MNPGSVNLSSEGSGINDCIWWSYPDSYGALANRSASFETADSISSVIDSASCTQAVLNATGDTSDVTSCSEARQLFFAEGKLMTPRSWSDVPPDDSESGPLPPVDPIEKLSRVSLELYQCLHLVQSANTKGLRCFERSSQGDGDSLDTQWLDRLFQTTDRFLSTLNTCLSITPNNRCLSVDVAPGSKDTSMLQGVQVVQRLAKCDAATELTILGCYTRLLQILEEALLVIKVQRDSGHLESQVQVRFGDFAPAADNRLHAHLLGQYVLYSMEKASEAVDAAIVSQQRNAQAVVEIRKVETKLRESIATLSF